MLDRVNRAVRLIDLGALAATEFDCGACGPIRLEAEVGKTTVALMLTPEVARGLGRALIEAAADRDPPGWAAPVAGPI